MKHKKINHRVKFAKRELMGVVVVVVAVGVAVAVAVGVAVIVTAVGIGSWNCCNCA